MDFFKDGVLTPSSNETLIVFLTKVDKPEFISQFCPVSLCNMFYKTITKVLVNRLKPLMGDL